MEWFLLRSSRHGVVVVYDGRKPTRGCDATCVHREISGRCAPESPKPLGVGDPGRRRGALQSLQSLG
jgi:hypothetical protein